ncbi:MAG: pyridoxamine 5'-phosphate oxidase family protein [Acidimicrobiales bacterium]
MSTPTTTIDRRYSSAKAEPTSWAATQHELETAEIFWLVTVRADGHPHMTPLVAAWSNDALHFTTGPEEQKSMNLRTNPHVILSTGCNDWQDGVDVVVEGDARQDQDQALLDDVALAFRSKWDGDTWGFTTHDGQFFHPEGFQVEVYSVAPTKVLAFAKGTFGHTVHRFND